MDVLNGLSIPEQPRGALADMADACARRVA
jgi:hypothetical protein